MNRKPRFGPLLVLVATLAVLAAGRASAQNQPKPWLPITPEELAMKDCPQQPGAPAIILYREEITDGENGTMSVIRRLKVLTEAGRDQSNIEIPYTAGYTKITGLEARVVTPDGKEHPFRGQVFDKTAVRYRKTRVAMKTFALPDVAVGSIIDYRYTLEPDSKGGALYSALTDVIAFYSGFGQQPEEGGIPDTAKLWAMPCKSWDVQEDLFTKKAKFSTTSNGFWAHALFGGPCRLAWIGVGLKDAAPDFKKGGGVSIELSDIPAFEDEEYAPPEESLRKSIDLFYVDSKVKDSTEYWKRESRDWQRGVEEFLGKPDKLAATAKEIVGNVKDPAEKLKKIYAKAQSLRNLSYEKDLSRKQRKEQKIKDNRNVADVLARGFGVRSDITRTFVALARAAGFEAQVVRVTARNDKLFRMNYLSFYGQLDSEMAAVQLVDGAHFYDPATRFCPFGLVHWSRTGSAGLRFSDAPPAFFNTPEFPPDQGWTQREVALTLDPQGRLAGTVKVLFTGHEALVRRLDHLFDDAQARKADFEKELSDVLPAGATVTMTKLENIDNDSQALIAYYDVVLPAGATAVGDKILMPLSPLIGEARYPFRHEGRRSPVYFPYPFREFDDIVITLPEGVTPEVRPEAHQSGNEFSSYYLSSEIEGPRRLHVRRNLTIKKSFFPVEKYQALKSFFDSVRAGDEAQIVLKAVAK